MKSFANLAMYAMVRANSTVCQFHVSILQQWVNKIVLVIQGDISPLLYLSLIHEYHNRRLYFIAIVHKLHNECHYVSYVFSRAITSPTIISSMPARGQAKITWPIFFISTARVTVTYLAVSTWVCKPNCDKENSAPTRDASCLMDLLKQRLTKIDRDDARK